MILSYKIYEGFLNKKKIYNTVVESVLLETIKLFKDYKDYDVLLKTSKNYNNISNILIYNKYDTSNMPLIIGFFNIKDELVIEYNLLRRDLFNYTFRSDTDLTKKENIVNNCINNIIDIKNKFEDNNNLIKCLKYELNEIKMKHKSKINLDGYLIKDYDFVVEYLLSKDLKNIFFVDLERCSKKIKDKYEYLINSKNFDLI